MNAETINMIRYVYEGVVCPLCGSRVAIIPAGGESFKERYCGHPEIEKIISQRRANYEESLYSQEPRTVRLKKNPLHADE
jgi:hypothetical protein